MIDLTNLEAIQKLDPKNIYESTGMLADQCAQIWQDARNVSFPDSYKNVENIVIAGMGGSAYGGYVVSSLFRDILTRPLLVWSDYGLPKFVNENTLVIATSYSGSTEEVLTSTQEAQRRGAKLVGLTSGGKLGEFLQKNSIPSLLFLPQFNPSGQPRLGTGYIVLGTIALLARIGLLSVDQPEVEKAVTELKQNYNFITSLAQDTAQKIVGNIPVIFASEFLVGNARILRNQFNETSKSFSAFEDIPELNHHLMEGFVNPKDKKLITVFLESGLYSEVIKKRITLTKDVVSKNSVESLSYKVQASTKLAQMLEVLSFSGYLSLYLALLYGQDPSLIPWVDYFKEKLA